MSTHSAPRPTRQPSGRPPRAQHLPFWRFNIGALLRDPHDMLDRRLHQKLDLVGFDDLRRHHGLVFQYIGERSRVIDLAARAQMTKQAMAEIVDYLERRGYVTRTVDPDDRRAKPVQLTDKGRSAQPAALNAIAEIEEEWKASFGGARFERLRGELAALREALEQPAEAPRARRPDQHQRVGSTQSVGVTSL